MDVKASLESWSRTLQNLKKELIPTSMSVMKSNSSKENSYSSIYKSTKSKAKTIYKHKHIQMIINVYLLSNLLAKSHISNLPMT